MNQPKIIYIDIIFCPLPSQKYYVLWQWRLVVRTITFEYFFPFSHVRTTWICMLLLMYSVFSLFFFQMFLILMEWKNIFRLRNTFEFFQQLFFSTLCILFCVAPVTLALVLSILLSRIQQNFPSKWITNSEYQT